MAFDHALKTLIDALDPANHASEIASLQACRSRADLDVIVDDGGWLGPGQGKKRRKLVRHGSGTYLVVEYDDGWSTRLGQASFS
ncbi:MAG: hypothetical protein AAGA48_33375 [Myxococcota bacterium]